MQTSFEILSLKDFSQLVVPFQNDNIQLYLTPKDYVEVENEKYKNFNKIQNKIKEAKLLEEQEKALHVAIQGYFREWLMTSGNVKSISEIVKMIDISSSSPENDDIIKINIENEYDK